jgi:hypothetical protein
LGTVAAPGSVVSAIPTVPRLEPIDKPSNVKVIRKMGSSFTPSIKDALAGNVPDNKNTEVEQKTIFSQLQEIRSEPFSQEQFEAKWSEYIEQLTDRPNLKSTLSVIPEMTDGNKLLLRIGNSVQEEEVRLAKPELMTWLRNELQNDGIELITRFEKVETERVIFSDSEKMQMMMQKNPNLFELKQKFNLDFKD